MKKILASLVFVAGIVQIAEAQTTPRPNRIRPASLGVSFFLNDFITPQRIRSTSLSQVFRDNTWAEFRQMDPGIAVTYFKGLHRNIDFAGTLAGSFTTNPVPGRLSQSNSALFLEGDASFNFKMLPDNFLISPYLIAGVGGTKFENYYSAFIPLGGGIKVNFFEEASFFITNQYRIPITKETNSYHFFTSIGIAGVIGKKKEEELRPLPPAPPADTDGDGINDDADKCPTVAGVAKYNGCPVPDTDGDGINDELDQCPNVAGVAKYNGCPIPDKDGDGINDEEDKCPDVAGTARYQGCPIPDKDNDGVNDEEDKCPEVAGTRANNGCPEVKQEVINRVNYAARNVFFITGSAKLSSKSNKALDEVARILNEDKNLKLSIEGHTDNVGKSEFNQKLSEDRAASVKAYLAKKGVDEARLASQGFGLTQPIADNKTAAGRSKNRRVEMKLGYE